MASQGNGELAIQYNRQRFERVQVLRMLGIGTDAQGWPHPMVAFRIVGARSKTARSMLARPSQRQSALSRMFQTFGANATEAVHRSVWAPSATVHRSFLVILDLGSYARWCMSIVLPGREGSPSTGAPESRAIWIACGGPFRGPPTS